MELFLSRIWGAIKSFFPEVKKSFCFQSLTPAGRLEYVVHSIMLSLLYLSCSYFVVFSLSRTETIWSNTNIILIGILVICFFISLGRFFLNRVLDLAMHFNDEKKLFYSPKIMLLLVVIFTSIFTILVLLIIFRITDKNSFLLILIYLSFVLAGSLLLSLSFPSRTLNIFENISFSNKQWEFIFFVLCGILQFLVLLHLIAKERYFYNSYLTPILTGITFLALFLVIFGKNAFVRLLSLSVFVSSILALLDNKSLILPVYSIPLILIFLTCRKNFLLCIIPILGLKLSFNHYALFIFLFCLYFVLIIDFFEFKKQDEFFSSLLWATFVSALYIFIFPLLLHIPLPYWLQDLPLPMLFVFLAILFMGIIYINCKIKNHPQTQLAIIVCLGIILTTSRCLPYFLEDFGLPFDFLPIALVLLFWIISNDEKISSAYKLAICSILLMLQILPEQNLDITMMPILFSCRLLCVLLLAYLFYKIKSSFRIIIYFSAFLYILNLVFAIIVDNRLHSYALIINQYAIKSFLFPLPMVLSYFLANMLFCIVYYYILNKHKNTFNANLTLKQ